MSETWVDAVDTEDYEDVGEGTYDSEDIGESSYDSEDIGEGGYEEFGEESRAARRRRERQRQILLERQRQAQLRRSRRPTSPARRPLVPQRPVRPSGPAQRQTITAIRSLDLETKVGQDSLRRAVAESNRRATRATWAAVGGTAVDQGLDSFASKVTNQYLRAGARFAPLLFLAPEKKRGGVEGFVTDPRFIGGAAILGIALLGNFTSRPQEVSSVYIAPIGKLTAPAPAAPPAPAGTPVTGQLVAYARDRNGANLSPQPTFTWKSYNSAMTLDSAGNYTLTAVTAAVTIQVSAQTPNGITGYLNVKVKAGS
jgi:hypothetical protein